MLAAFVIERAKEQPMESSRFDAFTRLLGSVPSRRALLPIAGSALAVLWGGLLTTAAKKKKKNKKATLCLDGQTIKATKKKKKKLLKRGATRGPCCAPTCLGTTCGGDDGCGGVCGCAAGSVCDSGICQSCTVSCTGDSAACGASLQTHLNGGGTVRACPGRYRGTFQFLAANTVLIGAGDGDDDASNTILDAGGSGRVAQVNANVIATLQGVRITGGTVADAGGGILNSGQLSLTACTISNNVAGSGGGIFHLNVATGPLALTGCQVSGNTANLGGGGIQTDSTTRPVTLTNCTVSGNRSTTGGGGIINISPCTINGTAITGNETAGPGGGLVNTINGTVAFDAASSVIGNTASDGGGIFNNSGTVSLNGAQVSGNTPNQCAGPVPVAGCSG